MEKVVTTELQSLLALNDQFDIFQSGFRSHHSTKTALVRVISNLLLSGDVGNLLILLLFYLSSDFDTLCHKLLLMRLSGAGLFWFPSYLTDRQYCITMHNYKSPSHSQTGCSTGLSSRPINICYLLYILPLGQIIHHHGFHSDTYCLPTRLYSPDCIAIFMYQWVKNLNLSWTFSFQFEFD